MNIRELFQIAVDKNASDLHLVVGLLPFVRIDGELHEIEGQKPLTEEQMEEMAFSIITEEERQRFVGSRELDFGFEIDSKVRFRVNLHYAQNTIGLVARVITDVIPSLSDIMMPKMIYNLLNLKQGLILLTGPTGCGKSTNMAAMINYINQNMRCHIITLEDPIEYVFHPDRSIIIQRQLGTDIISFSEGLKHALRQDPNVIMVGEMRDLETIATTITLAETGHLVLATLHTYNAAQTIDRIIDIFPPHQQNQIRMQMSMVLAGVISQRLLQREGGGRAAAREIMINTPAVANLIRENKISQIKTVIETSAKEGMFTLDQDIHRMYKEKSISRETAVNYMLNPEMLDKYR